jgi:adenylosuccinate lyase
MWDNIESTQGLIFSQRVLLALIDKGMAREAAYQIVQRNAALGWDNDQDFRKLIKSDKDASAYLSTGELDELFDYGYYTRYVDDTFQRLGLLSAKVAV